MQARRKRVLAVAGIAAVAILAGVLIALTAYPQGGGLSSNPCPGLSPCPFAVSGDITIGTDQGAGMITLTVVNQANLPFIDIHLVNAGPNLTGISGFTPFTRGDGRVVSPAYVLEVGANSTGYYSFTSGGINATPYTLTVEAEMSNGQFITETASIVSDS
ncbi:MAG: hypothetical protein OK441_04995 [Thaumarchaeota archaeon]|nr:hypothetical protein [Nitrososphaerota archaeon]